MQYTTHTYSYTNLQLQPVSSGRAKWLRAVLLIIENVLFPNSQNVGSSFYGLRLRALRRAIIRIEHGSPFERITSEPAQMPTPLSPSLSPLVPMDEDAFTPDEEGPDPDELWEAFRTCSGCYRGRFVICEETAGASCLARRIRNDTMEDLLDQIE